jgi:hypothetical protein
MGCGSEFQQACPNGMEMQPVFVTKIPVSEMVGMLLEWSQFIEWSRLQKKQ